jgi:hypothetical protein
MYKLVDVALITPWLVDANGKVRTADTANNPASCPLNYQLYKVSSRLSWHGVSFAVEFTCMWLAVDAKGSGR